MTKYKACDKCDGLMELHPGGTEYKCSYCGCKEPVQPPKRPPQGEVPGQVRMEG